MTFNSVYFVTIRQRVREHLLSRSADGRRLNELVAQLLHTDLEEGDAGDAPQAALLRTTGGPVPVPRATIEVDVDCEFDENGFVYLWGAAVAAEGEDPVYHHFGSPDPDADERAIAAEFADWLENLVQQTQDQDVRWYHYGMVELNHLQRLVKPAVFRRLAPLGVDLLTDVIRPHFFAPGGYGLKKLAGVVAEATWRTAGATGQDALVWIQRARAGDQGAWSQLLKYNEDDTQATRLLRNVLAGPAPRREW